MDARACDAQGLGDGTRRIVEMVGDVAQRDPIDLAVLVRQVVSRADADVDARFEQRIQSGTSLVDTGCRNASSGAGLNELPLAATDVEDAGRILEQQEPYELIGEPVVVHVGGGAGVFDGHDPMVARPPTGFVPVRVFRW